VNTIVLHGRIAKKFGDHFVMDVSSAREAFFALCSQLSGFEAYVRKSAFRVVREKAGLKLGLDEVSIDVSAVNCTIHIYPAMVGAKSGIGKVLIGIAIIGITIATSGAGGILAAGGTLGSAATAMASGIGFMGLTYGGIAAFGAMIAFGGLAMMFAPSPKAQGGAGKASKDESSFILSGPVNTPFQGGRVPLVYGLYLTGSITISSELTIAQLLHAGGVAVGGGGTGTGGGGTYDGTSNPYFPDYPDATAGVGGSGIGGVRTARDAGLVNEL
jgi:predicted phage tail protein